MSCVIIRAIGSILLSVARYKHYTKDCSQNKGILVNTVLLLGDDRLLERVD